MNKKEFEQILGKEIDEEAFDKIKRVWLTFFSISLEEATAMYFSTDSETRSLFDEGYDLSRGLDILHRASAQMYNAGLENIRDDLFEYCIAKENAYEEKVHAANLEESISKAEGVEEQK